MEGTLRSRNALISLYWKVHPRFTFFKSLAHRTELVDIGAGTGGLANWRAWGEPERTDLAMYAIDLVKGQFFDLYADYDLVKLGKTESKYPNAAFNAAMLSHVIEYVEDLDAFAAEVGRLCGSRAKVYVEWPNVHTVRSIGREELSSFGIACSTMNFFDDSAHVFPLSREVTKGVFQDAGFRTLSEGNVMNDLLYPELFRYGVIENDAEATTYALWLALRFSQFIILEKAE